MISSRWYCSYFLVVLTFLLRCSALAIAGDPAAVLPQEPRTASVQSPQEFFGFAIGSRHLRHDQVTAYWNYLAETSERVALIPFGASHGMRPLMAAAISSPQNIGKLQELRKQRPMLTTGRFSGSLDDQKIVMFMGYSVHGDEASAVNAAPLVAYHLVASQSEEVSAWLEHSIFLVDPALNPDGIDRFANWANETRGRFASDSGDDREHNQPWPGGRSNYYWFDLNRDLLPATHPESQGRLKLFQQWRPNVVLDFHEMGGTSSYFFQPGIPARNNPLSPAQNLELTRKFATEHSKSMDEANELYFTEERFDDFYPGKGSTYPDLHGAVGILFEQGSTRGLKLVNESSNRHFRDTVANQVRTSLSSLRAAHTYRRELLALQRDFYAAALEAGTNDATTAYILTGSPSRIHAAAQLLSRHAIKVFQPVQEIRLNEQSFAVGNAIVVPTAQAEYQFLRSLMEPLQDFEENIFYDVSTWHLPSAFDIEMHRHQADVPGFWVENTWHPAQKLDSIPTVGENQPVSAFAFSPEELDAPRLVTALQRIGAAIRVSTSPSVATNAQQEEDLPIGTFLVLKQPNQSHWEKITKLMRSFDARTMSVKTITSGLTAVGPDLGSNTTLILPKCKPLLIVGEGTTSNEAGALWHFLDQRLNQPTTLVDAARIGSVELSSYTCVILPGGGYSDWGREQVEQLKAYVRSGGTVIAVTSSISWLKRSELLAKVPPEAVSQGQSKAAESPQELLFGDAETAHALETIAGAFVNVHVDPTHPLAYGFTDTEIPVFRDHTSRFDLPQNPYHTVGRYTQVLAGYVSSRNRERLAGSAAVWVEPAGKGKFILLADNPVFRGYVRSSERFLTNAVLIGPAFSLPSAPATDSASHEDEHAH